MAMKRARDEVPVYRKSVKRPKVDTDLAKIWEQLADDSEDVRLDAAFELLQNHLSGENAESVGVIARRLVRGLCSSRKCARLGFYVALVGALSMKTGPFGMHDFPISMLLQTIEAQTRPESGTSGQDERDHYFGRMVACKSILDSEVLLNTDTDTVSAWDKVYDILCGLMIEKPWMRPECTATLNTAIQEIAKNTKPGQPNAVKAVSQLFDLLKDRKLLRTIDGVSIWLTAKDALPRIKFPQGVWSQDNPFHVKDLQILKKVLLDSKTNDDAQDEVLGNSGWSPKLHPAWSLIFKHLQAPKFKGQLSLQQFWLEIVDNGLFSASSTPERKHTGFLVFEAALEQLGEKDLVVCFSKNLINTLVQTLRTPHDVYLSNTVRSVLSTVQTLSLSRNPTWSHQIIVGLIAGSDFIDFDTVTRTKTVHSLFERSGIEQGQFVKLVLSWVTKAPSGENDSSKIALKRRTILSILQRAVCQAVHQTANDAGENISPKDEQWKLILDVIKHVLDLKQNVDAKALEQPFDEATSDFLKEKIAVIMEALLAAGAEGWLVFMQAISSLRDGKFEAEETIQNTVKSSWTTFDRALRHVQKAETGRVNDTSKEDKTYLKHKLNMQQGLGLLFALLLYEVYDGDVESAEILQDAIAMSKDMSASGDTTKAADQVIEIVLSFLSRPSKFLRRASNLIFDAFSSQMSLEGLQSLCNILSTKESRDGQQELFENGESDVEEGVEDDEESASDMDELDSDVELVDVDEKVEDNHEDSDSDATSEEDPEAETGAADGADEEGLASLESALAKALGTRKLTQDDVANADSESEDASDSDADMSDSDMMELDDKLAEVFRNQQGQTSAQRIRKEEMKSARENVINLKNRATDLVELFFRQQQTRGMECAQLLVSLLEMARTTGTSQLTNRATELVKSFVRKCRGAKLPKVEHDANTRARLKTNLAQLHAGLLENDVSNTTIEVTGQVNVLLCRLLMEAGEEEVVTFVNEASEQRRSQSDGRRKAYDEFWTRFDDWAVTVQGKDKEDKGVAQVNGAEKAEQTGRSAKIDAAVAKAKVKQHKNKKSKSSR